MSDLKLVVGKRYLNAQGEIVEIVRHEKLTTHPYVGSDGEQYRPNGRIGFFRHYEIDLIEETDRSDRMRPDPWRQFFQSIVDGTNSKAA